jgi:hypothetical protein
MKLKLRHPIPLGSKPIEELTFRDYTVAADYLSFDVRGGVAQNIALIASLTGTDEALIRQLRGPDYRAATAIADGMLAKDGEAAGEGDAEKKPSAS